MKLHLLCPSPVHRCQSTFLPATKSCLCWRHWTGPWTPLQPLLRPSTLALATSLERCLLTALSLTRHRRDPSLLWTTPIPVRASNWRRVVQSESWPDDDLEMVKVDFWLTLKRICSLTSLRSLTVNVSKREMYEDIFKKIILPTITTFSWDHVGLNYMLSVCFFVFTQKLLVQQTHNSYFYPLFFFYILGPFPRILRCFRKRRMRNHAVNQRHVATSSLWTSRRCVFLSLCMYESRFCPEHLCLCVWRML